MKIRQTSNERGRDEPGLLKAFWGILGILRTQQYDDISRIKDFSAKDAAKVRNELLQTSTLDYKANLRYTSNLYLGDVVSFYIIGERVVGFSFFEHLSAAQPVCFRFNRPKGETPMELITSEKLAGYRVQTFLGTGSKE